LHARFVYSSDIYFDRRIDGNTLETVFLRPQGIFSRRFSQEHAGAPVVAEGCSMRFWGVLSLIVTAMVARHSLGVLAGTYLAEYGRTSKLGDVVRFCNDILLSAPSIVIGLFIYGIIVLPSKHFSAWAGAASLCLIAIPVIVRTSEDMLRLVPNSLREAGVALGCPYWKMIVKIGWRSARPGIITGNSSCTRPG